MKRTKLRNFKLGALFLLMGLFFVLLTGCDTLLPGSTAKNENVELALEQTLVIPRQVLPKIFNYQ
jgi:hypothetical protein